MFSFVVYKNCWIKTLYMKLYDIKNILENVSKVSYFALNWNVNVYGVSFNTNLKPMLETRHPEQTVTSV